jgi:hypothetical protein
MQEKREINIECSLILDTVRDSFLLFFTQELCKKCASKRYKVLANNIATLLLMRSLELIILDEAEV